MTRAAKYILASQTLLVITITICTILMPQFLFSTDQGGVSNYGVQTRTLWVFTLGFIGCGVLIIAGALTLPISANHRRALRNLLLLIGVLTLVVAVTTYTYKISHFFNLLHVYSTVALFLAQVPITLWFYKISKNKKRDGRLLAIFILGFTLSVLTYFGLIHVLFVAEVTTIFSFGALMVLMTRQATSH